MKQDRNRVEQMRRSAQRTMEKRLKKIEEIPVNVDKTGIVFVHKFIYHDTEMGISLSMINRLPDSVILKILLVGGL